MLTGVFRKKGGARASTKDSRTCVLCEVQTRKPINVLGPRNSRFTVLNVIRVLKIVIIVSPNLYHIVIFSIIYSHRLDGGVPLFRHTIFFPKHAASPQVGQRAKGCPTSVPCMAWIGRDTFGGLCTKLHLFGWDG